MSTPLVLKREGVGLNGGNPATVSIGTFQAGTVLALGCRYSEFVNNATTNPNNDASEGPYLRIYPAMGNGPLASAMPGNSESVTFRKGAVETAIPIPQDEANDGSGFYFEIDAIAQKPVYLPFPCSVVLATQKAGCWIFDWTVWEEKHYSGSRVYQQSRVLRNGTYPAGIVSRTLWVPRGATDYRLLGFEDSANLVHLQAEDSVGVQSDFYEWFGYQGGFSVISDKGLMNSRRLAISVANNPPTNGGNLAVVFEIHI